MTTAAVHEQFTIVSRLKAGFYFSPPDFSDPKSHWERPESELARAARRRAQRTAQSARYQQRQREAGLRFGTTVKPKGQAA